MRYLYFLSFLILTSCGGYGVPQIKFDKELWNKNYDGYHDRRSMIEDVTVNHDFNGKNIEDLRTFFGYANHHTTNDTIVVQYDIYTDFGWDIDPVYTEDLLYYLNKDSVVIGNYLSKFQR